MLLAKVKDHNTVNGFRFTAVEFLIAALIVLPFAIYYLTHARWGMGVAATGIVANALMVAALSIRSLARGEKDIGIRRMFDPSGRSAIHAQYPSLSRDTVLLSVALLIPFLLLLDAAYARATRRIS